MSTLTAIHKTNLPSASLLLQPDQRQDYVDSYSSVIERHGQNLAIEDVAKAFLTSGPEWVENLFALRNRIVGRFGLKTGDASNN